MAAAAEAGGIEAAENAPPAKAPLVSAAAALLESVALSSLALAEGFAASPAPSRNVGIRKTAHAAVAIIFALNLIVVSCIARRDDPYTTAAG
jgi:VanZ family protein